MQWSVSNSWPEAEVHREVGHLENVGVDRIGCAWLIRHYIDPKAKFLFIPCRIAIAADGSRSL